MVKTIYQADGVVDTVYDPTIKTVIATWYDFFQFQHMRPCLEKQMECVRDGAKVILVDSRETTGAVRQEDQAYFGTTLFPFFQEHGLKALITVQPESALPRLSAKQWQVTASDFSFDIVDTPSLEVAKELAREYADGTR